MKKLIYFLLILSLSLCAFCVVAFAEEIDNPEHTAQQTEQQELGEDIEKEKTSFPESLYRAYEENKSELFSFASTVVSLILVFVYQKGLLPTLKGGLNLIEGQVKALREVSTDTKEQNQKAALDTHALAYEMAQSAEKMQSTIEGICVRTEDIELRQQTLKRMEDCLLWQAELLGEVFLHSSLPEYEKERVTHVLERVKKTLTQKESEA